MHFYWFFSYFIATVYFYGKVVIFVVTCFFLLWIIKRPLKESRLCNCLVVKKPLRLRPKKWVKPWDWKINLEDLLITNYHHWILCRFHDIVILTLGVYTIVPALSLSSLLTPKILGDPTPLNTQPKSFSLTRIWIQKPN